MPGSRLVVYGQQNSCPGRYSVFITNRFVMSLAHVYVLLGGQRPVAMSRSHVRSWMTGRRATRMAPKESSSDGLGAVIRLNRPSLMGLIVFLSASSRMTSHPKQSSIGGLYAAMLPSHTHAIESSTRQLSRHDAYFGQVRLSYPPWLGGLRKAKL